MEESESGGWFSVDAFGRYLASVAIKMFKRLIYYINLINVVFSIGCAKIMLQ
jgi:hypothetical protein